MEGLTTSKLLQENVKNLSLSNRTLEILNRLGIQRIDDIAKLDRQELLTACINLGLSYEDITACVDEIEIKLYSNNLCLGMDTNISDEKRAEALNSPMANLGISIAAASMLQTKGVNTLLDATNYTITEFRELLNRNFESSIKKIDYLLTKYGRKFKRPNFLNEHTNPLINYVDVESLNNEEKNEFFSRPISDIGLSIKATQRLNQYGLYTIGDVAKITNSELREAACANKDVSIWIKRRLEKFNIHIDTMDQDVYFSEPIVKAQNILDMSDQERELFLKRNIKDLGVSGRIVKVLAENDICTIGQVYDIDAKALKKVLKDFTYPTYYKLVEVLDLFGIDKKLEQFDTSFKPVKIKGIKFKELSEEKQNELLAQGLDSIGLSEKIIERLKRKQVYTIGDLIELSSSEFRDEISNSPYSQLKTRERLLSIGLDFSKQKTYFDNPLIETFDFNEATQEEREQLLSSHITNLGIRGHMVDVIKKVYGAVSVGDLINLTAKDIQNAMQGKVRYQLEHVTDILGKFGLKLKTESLSKIKPENINGLEEDEKTLILDKDLKEFDLNPFIQKKLEKIKIVSLRDLAEAPKPYIRTKTKINSQQMHSLESFLAGFGLQMKYSNCLVVDGKVVSKVEDLKNAKSQKKATPIDINGLNMEEREIVIETKLEDLGLPVRALDLLREKQGIETIRDIMQVYRSDVKAILANNKTYYQAVADALNEYGIQLQDRRRQIFSGIHDAKKKKNDQKQERKDACKDVEDYLALSLEDFGFAKKTVKKFAALGYKTVGDITLRTKKELNQSLQDYSLVHKLKNMLQECGLDFAEDDIVSKPVKIKVIEPRVISDISQEERSTIFDAKIEEIGFAKPCVKILRDIYGVETFENVLQLDAMQIYLSMENDRYSYVKIREKLRAFGIDIPEYKVMHSAKKHGNFDYMGRPLVLQTQTNGALFEKKDSSEDKYYMRKMAHAKAYFDYIKARNNKQLNSDFELNN